MACAHMHAHEGRPWHEPASELESDREHEPDPELENQHQHELDSDFELELAAPGPLPGRPQPRHRARSTTPTAPAIRRRSERVQCRAVLTGGLECTWRCCTTGGPRCSGSRDPRAL